ncbi:MAG: LysE family translocator [Actinomycetales bacterium]|nr:LysE family translocator [Actinomycetales bacterium]
MTQVLLAFVGATLVIVLSPGPDTLLVLRNAAAGGRRAAAWTTLGILVGGLAWLVAVVAGLAALIRSSEAVYGSLRYLGAAYLAYLGARSLWGWWRTRDVRVPSFAPEEGADDGEGRELVAPSDPLGALPADPTVLEERSWWGWARQGLTTNLLNAKFAAFLVAFFPQFVLPGMSRVHGTIVLAVVFWAIAVLWYAAMLVAIGRLATWIARPRVRRGIGGLSGAILVVMAVVVAVGH